MTKLLKHVDNNMLFCLNFSNIVTFNNHNDDLGVVVLIVKHF